MASKTRLNRKLDQRAPTWSFVLYVAGNAPRSALALRAITELCEERLAGDYGIEVVDLLKQPARAAADQIAALPCLARVAPGPARRVVGGLSDKAKLAALLSIA